MHLKELLQSHPNLPMPSWHRHPTMAGILGALVAITYIAIVVAPFARAVG